MNFTDILFITLLGIALFIGFLLFIGKVKLVIVYRDEENYPSWKEEEDNAVIGNYVRPLETPKPPTLLETPKRRRGRPRKAVALPAPPAL